MKCVLALVLVILIDNVLSDETEIVPGQMQPSAQFYKTNGIHGKSASTVVCIEVSHGPNHSGGMTKVCGPQVTPANQAPPAPVMHQSQTRAAVSDSLALPNEMSPFSMLMTRQAAPDSMPSCSSGRHFSTGIMPNMNYDTGFASPMPFSQQYPGPRMTIEAPMRNSPMPIMMEKSREMPMEFPAYMSAGSMWRPMAVQQRYQTTRQMLQNPTWMPLNFNQMATPTATRAVMPMQASQTSQMVNAPPSSTNSRTSSPSTTTQETELEKLKKECESKDKLLEERNTEIEVLQKELSSAKRQPTEMGDKETAPMDEPKVTKRSESPNITQIGRKK